MPLEHRTIGFDDRTFNHYFLCWYIPKAVAIDKLSQSLICFKEGLPPHRQAWSDCAVELAKSIDGLDGACVIRALHHSEQQIRDHDQNALDTLGVKLAHVVAGRYQPDCLYKTKNIPKLARLTRSERETAMKQAYRFMVPERAPAKVLIIDDIYTTGATTQSILAAVLQALPSTDVSIFTLASTDYDPALNSGIELKASYEWVNENWMVVAEDSAEYAITLARLKAYIMKGSFAD